MTVLLTPVWGFLAFARLATYDCNDHPPEKTFVRYFGAPPPGVRDIRSTGHISLGGAEVWLRFRTTQAALTTLLAGYLKSDPPDARAECHMLAGQIPSSPYRRAGEVPAPEHRVQWDELRHVRNADVYFNADSTFSNTLVYDRSREVAYFYHWNQ
jgi:hypothetical protein